MLNPDEKKQTHDYILFNDEDVASNIDNHKAILRMSFPRMKAHTLQVKHKAEFANWFKDHIGKLIRAKQPIVEGLKLLAEGPFTNARRFKGFTVRGYNFRTVDAEKGHKTQSSGVVIDATAPCFASSKDKNPIDAELTYYGRLTDIVELSYQQGRIFVLFKCDWVDVVNKDRGKKVDELGFTLVNFNHLLPCQHDEPYAMSSQVRQVFYVQDPEESDWHVVVRIKLRDTFDMGGEDDGQLLNSDPYGNLNQVFEEELVEEHDNDIVHVEEGMTDDDDVEEGGDDDDDDDVEDDYEDGGSTSDD